MNDRSLALTFELLALFQGNRDRNHPGAVHALRDGRAAAECAASGGQPAPPLHLDSDVPEGRPSGLYRPTMLFFAVTIHNFPEGMAVDVVLAGYLAVRQRSDPLSRQICCHAIVNKGCGANTAVPPGKASTSASRAVPKAHVMRQEGQKAPA